MRPDLEQQLVQKYPEMFQLRTKPSTEGPQWPLALFGTECGDGWFDILDLLCHEIRHYQQFKKQEPITITQIKEKFGTLRFYYEGGDDVVYALSNFAESISGRVCEDCGQPGRTRSGGWVRTLCDFHAEEMGYHTDERF